MWKRESIGAWFMAAMMLLAVAVLMSGCTNDRKQLNEHNRVLDSEKD